jgi:hypothetical protein
VIGYVSNNPKLVLTLTGTFIFATGTGGLLTLSR